MGAPRRTCPARLPSGQDPAASATAGGPLCYVAWQAVLTSSSRQGLVHEQTSLRDMGVSALDQKPCSQICRGPSARCELRDRYVGEGGLWW